MRPKKAILIVDDKDQSDNISFIKRSLSSKFDMEFIFINTSVDAIDNNEDVSWELLRSSIFENIKGKKISLALTDYQLDSTEFNGLNVAAYLSSMRKNTPIILYTGERKKVIKDFLKGRSIRNTENVVDCICDFLDYKIYDFKSREDYKEAAIKFIKQDDHYHLDEALLQELRKYSDKKLRLGCEYCKNMTLGEIADAIERKDSTAVEWLEELINQTSSYLIKIND